MPSTTAAVNSPEIKPGRALRDVPEDLREPALGDDADHCASGGAYHGPDPELRRQVAGRATCKDLQAGLNEARQADRRPARTGQGRRRRCREPRRPRTPGAGTVPAVPALDRRRAQAEGRLAPAPARAAVHEPVDPRASRSSSATRSCSAPTSRSRTTTCSRRRAGSGSANYEYLFNSDQQIWPAVKNTLWMIADRRAAEGALRVRRRADARARAARRRRLPHRSSTCRRWRRPSPRRSASSTSSTRRPGR